jgi:hypothetical protein
MTWWVLFLQREASFFYILASTLLESNGE